MINRLKKGRENPYVQVPKTITENGDLSFAIKGFLAYLLGKPDDWRFEAKNIARQSKENEHTIGRYFTALEEEGYVRRQQLWESGRKAGYEYTVYEAPVTDVEKRLPKSDTLTKNERTKKEGKVGRDYVKPSSKPPPLSLEIQKMGVPGEFMAPLLAFFDSCGDPEETFLGTLELFLLTKPEKLKFFTEDYYGFKRKYEYENAEHERIAKSGELNKRNIEKWRREKAEEEADLDENLRAGEVHGPDPARSKQPTRAVA